MKRNELINIHNTLFEIGKLKSNVTFIHRVAMNLQLIKSEIEALAEAQQPSREYQEFQQKRVKLLREHADKDGNPIDESGQAKLSTANRKKFERAFVKLQETYKSAIDDEDKRLQQYNELIQEEIDEPKWHLIPFESLPEEGLTANQLNVLFPLISEPQEDEATS